jgi:glycosyltransferase involved in cell wall biosynthesis
MNPPAICEMPELRDGDANACEQADLARSFGRVAIVHDYLNQRGGAEKVVLELSDMWPQAPIYASLYRPGSTFEEFRGRDIRTSFLDRLPVDRGFRNLFPLYPAAFWSFGEIDADVVIASSSGWSHMARAARSAVHVVYCHTPARWLYRGEHLGADRRAAVVAGAASFLRRIDRRAALRADAYIANCENVRTLIAEAYQREARVVWPPVDVNQYTPRPRGQRLLVISRLLPYKRVDLAVSAAKRLGLGLDVVGDGPMIDDLRRLGGEGVVFHGAVSQASVRALLEGCSLVCVPGEEDFGIVAVEAQAAGKPVVAYRRGGARETVVDGVTGLLFERQTAADVVAAIKACERLDTPPEQIAQSVARFSRVGFREGIVRAIADARREVRREPNHELTGVAP